MKASSVRPFSIIVVVCLVVLGGTAWAQQPDVDSRAIDVHTAMNNGIAAFKAARYEEAATNFRTATELDPTNGIAHLYLGTTYEVQVVPNLLSPENLQIAALALKELDIVLMGEPGELTAMKQEDAIYRNLQRYGQAMEMEKRIAALEPNEPEAFYIMGFIDWTLAYKNAVEALANDGLTDDGMGNRRMTHTACEKLRLRNTPLVVDGIASLERAIQLNPNYDDAMQYLQLTYRRRADFACGEQVAVSADLRLADQWTRKAIEVRRQTEELQHK
jgi:tetratricopeptide (TPR) repeat protein